MTTATLAARPLTDFGGSVPRYYDADLGPLLFEFSAHDLATRVRHSLPRGGRILEVACGTGISTELLRRELADDIEIVATDVNSAMLGYAIEQRGHLVNVHFEQADALELPYAAEGFDAVVCQFGVMFFADKQRGFDEMSRVLKSGGSLFWNVWGSLDDNRVVKTVHETMARFFSEEPPRFLEIPFGFYDEWQNKILAMAAGLGPVEVDLVRAQIPHRASSAARGLVQGTPGVAEIEARADVDVATVTHAATVELERVFGAPVPQFELAEYVFHAHKP